MDSGRASGGKSYLALRKYNTPWEHITWRGKTLERALENITGRGKIARGVRTVMLSLGNSNVSCKNVLLTAGRLDSHDKHLTFCEYLSLLSFFFSREGSIRVLCT